MIPNALDRLAKNLELQAWWQAVLNDERYVAILEAAKVKVKQTPPATIPPGFSPMEIYGLSFAAMLAADASLDVLDTLGSRAFGEARHAEQLAKRGQEVMSPAKAGTGPGRLAAEAASGAPPASSEPEPPTMPPPPLIDPRHEE